MQLYLSPYTARDKGFLAHRERYDAQLGSLYAVLAQYAWLLPSFSPHFPKLSEIIIALYSVLLHCSLLSVVLCLPKVVDLWAGKHTTHQLCGQRSWWPPAASSERKNGKSSGERTELY